MFCPVALADGLDLREELMDLVVYDIGLHNGGDTRQYLREGCRVIAIDANPAMCAAAAAEFQRYIDTKRLTVLNCGVAERAEKLEFWICDDVTAWSSFDREIASRNGAKHYALQVECVPIQDILARFGVPDYMKIDIEGNERYCLEGLTKDTRPRYISIELDHVSGSCDIQRLHELGYRRFKIICQDNAWTQATENNLWFYKLGPHSRFVPPIQRLAAISRRINGRKAILAGRQEGESGPWGEQTHGPWQSFDHTQRVWSALHNIDMETGTHGLGWWFDIHATI
jgi:FkbM family methyltransferase